MSTFVEPTTPTSSNTSVSNDFNLADHETQLEMLFAFLNVKDDNEDFKLAQV